MCLQWLKNAIIGGTSKREQTVEQMGFKIASVVDWLSDAISG
jgi:hypothetical protein